MASVLSPTATSDRGVRYSIAQYMEDVFRREVRNVGVIVQHGTNIAARFVGETDGRLDGRKLGAFLYPDVYRQWVAYWRRTIVTDPEALNVLRSTSRGNFMVIDGGLATDTGADSVEDVAAYLYAVLVSEVGWDAPLLPLAPAEDAAAFAAVSTRLPTELTNAFRQLNILATSTDELPLVSHPIRVKQPVLGRTRVPHEPQFTQQNGRLWVMEPLDFSGRSVNAARDHAGLTAFMFDDLKDAKGEAVETIAIYRAPEEPSSEDEAAVQYALAMIDKTRSRVVDWGRADERSAFIEERRALAVQAA